MDVRGVLPKGSGEAGAFPMAHVPRLGHRTVPWPHVCTHAPYLGRWAPVEFEGHLRSTCVSNPWSVITSVLSLHGVVDLEVTAGPMGLQSA